MMNDPVKYYYVNEYVLKNFINKEDIASTIRSEYKIAPINLHGMVMNLTKAEVIEALEITDPFDYSLPQAWVNDVIQCTGENPCPHFVWMYTGKTLLGEPFPISKEGVLLLKVYKFIKSTTKEGQKKVVLINNTLEMENKELREAFDKIEAICKETKSFGS